MLNNDFRSNILRLFRAIRKACRSIPFQWLLHSSNSASSAGMEDSRI